MFKLPSCPVLCSLQGSSFVVVILLAARSLPNLANHNLGPSFAQARLFLDLKSVRDYDPSHPTWHATAAHRPATRAKAWALQRPRLSQHGHHHDSCHGGVATASDHICADLVGSSPARSAHAVRSTGHGADLHPNGSCALDGDSSDAPRGDPATGAKWALVARGRRRSGRCQKPGTGLGRDPSTVLPPQNRQRLPQETRPAVDQSTRSDVGRSEDPARGRLLQSVSGASLALTRRPGGREVGGSGESGMSASMVAGVREADRWLQMFQQGLRGLRNTRPRHSRTRSQASSGQAGLSEYEHLGSTDEHENTDDSGISLGHGGHSRRPSMMDMSQQQDLPGVGYILSE